VNSPAEAIAHSLANSRMMLHRFTDDLTPAEYLHRATPKANCVAWLIGHIALADRRMLELLGVEPPKLPEGFAKQFSRDEGCPQAGEFGEVSRLLPIFDQHRDLLIGAVTKATPAQLDKPTERVMPVFKNVGECINFMALHTAMHAGQITLIRRSLGKPPIV